MLGMQILDYRLEKLIREEAIGSVYLALDVPKNLHVQICQLNAAMASDFFLQERIQEKVNALASLQHDCINQFYTYVQHDGHLYLISAYTPGVSLNEYINSLGRHLSEEKIWDIFYQLTEAFAYAHHQGITHLAIHPGDIIITADERVKVINFGVVSLFSDAACKRLLADVKLTQVQYMTPEHIQGKFLDYHTDIYALGVILFELLTRQSPYPSVLTQLDIENKIVKDSLPPTRLYTHNFTHSYTMQGIIDKATAKNAAFRFQSYEEMKECLLEEKDERESSFIAQLMNEVNNKSKLISSDSEKSTIKLAKRKKQRKLAGQVLVAITFIGGAIIIAMNIRNLPVSESDIALKEDNKPVVIDDATVDEAIAPVVKRNRVEQAPEEREAAQEPELKEPTVENRGTVQAGISLRPEGNSNAFSKTELEDRIAHFYEALGAKDLGEVKGYYAPTLIRFFNEYNVTDAKLKKLLQKAWQRTPEDRHDIIWESFQYYRDPQGNYVIDFFMNYNYRRANKDGFRTRKIYTIIKMDKDLRITYMSGD